MRSRSRASTRTDGAAMTALALAAVAAFVAQLAFGTQPAYFIPVGICALPFAASPSKRLHYRLAAAAMLVAFIAAVGLREGSVFLPALAALALSTYRAAPRRESRARRRR
jgi:hypothetical protein